MIKEIVKSSPYIIKKPIKVFHNFIPDYIKYGNKFRNTYNFLEKSQYWTKKEHEEYQIIQLKRIIDHAYNMVPYYKKLFSEYDIKPKDIQNFNDLKKIPYLTKEIIQNNLKDLISINYKKSEIYYVTTGGSTGIPLGFYSDKYSNAIENAFMYQQWKRVGYNVNKINKSVILRGNLPVKGLYEKIGNQLVLSSYHLTNENIEFYLKLIQEFNPDFIQAYPSAVAIVSDYIIKNNINLKLPNLKAILCGSENIYDFQREKIENAFKVRVYSWYGHTERCCLAGECEKNIYYHIFSEYGYTEIINENGKEVSEEDEVGEIVATGFTNYVVPFIRYKTMDLAVNTNKTCSCGRNYKLMKKVEGRLQDILITSKNYFIMADMITGSIHSDIFDNVSQFQFYQDTLGVCIFNIVKKSNYTEKDEKIIYRELKKKLGEDMNLIIKYVDNIPRTKSGKYRILIQKLDIKFGDR